MRDHHEAEFLVFGMSRGHSEPNHGGCSGHEGSLEYLHFIVLLVAVLVTDSCFAVFMNSIFCARCILRPVDIQLASCRRVMVLPMRGIEKSAVCFAIKIAFVKSVATKIPEEAEPDPSPQPKYRIAFLADSGRSYVDTLESTVWETVRQKSDIEGVCHVVGSVKPIAVERRIRQRSSRQPAMPRKLRHGTDASLQR